MVPLEKAELDIANDLKESMVQAKSVVRAVEELIAKNEGNRKQAEERHPRLVERVEQFYRELDEMIAERRARHLWQIDKYRAKMSYAYTTTHKELTELKRYL